MNIRVIPRPKSVKVSGADFWVEHLQLFPEVPGEDLTHLCREKMAELSAADAAPQGAAPRAGTMLPAIFSLVGNSRAAPDIDTEETLGKAEDAYILMVSPSGIKAFSSSRRGLIYAAQTLFQVIQREEGGFRLPSVRIDDYPDFVMRGVTDDISRRQVSTLENFKRIIRELSRYKYNYYFPYMEDMFRISKHPKIGATSGALTHEEARAVVEYARMYGIEVVPIVQTLGHVQKIVGLPEYRELAELAEETSPGELKCFEAGNEKVYSLLRDLFQELFTVFDSEYVHIGCDETRQLGEGKNREACQARGHAGVYIDHIKRVLELIKPYRKKVMFYADMFRPRYPAVGHWHVTPQDFRALRDLGLIFFNWGYNMTTEIEHYDYINILKREGARQIISPGVWGWKTIFPSFAVMADTTVPALKVAFDEGIRELCTSSWNDQGDNLREDNFLNYAYTAECLWDVSAAEEREARRFAERFCPLFYGSADGALVDAHVFLGDLPRVMFEAARHDPRYPRELPRYVQSSLCVSHLFWHPARAGKADAQDVERCRELVLHTSDLISRLDSLAANVPRNQGNVRSLMLGLRRARFIAASIVYAGDPKPEWAADLAGELSQRQWLSANKPERLDMMEERFDELIAFYRREAGLESKEGAPPIDEVPSPRTYLDSVNYDRVRRGEA